MSKKFDDYVVSEKEAYFSYNGKAYSINTGDRIRVFRKSRHLYINGDPICSELECMKVAKWCVGHMLTHLCSRCANNDQYHQMKIYVSIDEIEIVRVDRDLQHSRKRSRKIGRRKTLEQRRKGLIGFL